MTRSLTAAIGTPKTCPFLIMFIISYPRIVRRAVLKEPNPIPGLTNRLLPRWSCSTILLRYFIGCVAKNGQVNNSTRENNSACH